MSKVTPVLKLNVVNKQLVITELSKNKSAEMFHLFHILIEDYYTYRNETENMKEFMGKGMDDLSKFEHLLIGVNLKSMSLFKNYKPKIDINNESEELHYFILYCLHQYYYETLDKWEKGVNK